MSLVKTVDFKHIRLEPADNGFVLEYTEVTEKPGSLDSRMHHDRQMVFGQSEEDIDKAMSKMKELMLFKRKRMATETIPLPSILGSVLG